MNRPRILVLAIALALPWVSSYSAGIETRGQPTGVAPALGNYGMGVPTRAALKGMMPPGWRVYVHQGAPLPETLDWSMADTWLQALDRLARTSSLAVLVDWDGHTVMLRTTEVALQEEATRQEIAQAAVTPLPRFTPDTPVAAATQTLTVSGAPQADAPAVAGAVSSDGPVAVATPVAIAPTPVIAQAPVSDGVSPPSGTPVVVAVADTATPALHSPLKPPVAVEAAIPPAIAVPTSPAPDAIAPTPVIAQGPSSAGNSPPSPAPVVAALADTTPTATDPVPAPALKGIAAAAPASSAVASVTVTAPALTPAPTPAAALAQLQAYSAALDAAPPLFMRDGLSGSSAYDAEVSARMAQYRAPLNMDDVVSAPARTATPLQGREAPVALVAASAPTAPAPSTVASPSADVAPIVMPAIRTNPTNDMVFAQASAVASKPVKLVSTDEFTYTQAVAFNKPSLKKVVQAIAFKHKLRLVWAYDTDYQLKGPVTLLAQSAAQDIELLQKALGRGVPLKLEISADGQVLKGYKQGALRPATGPVTAATGAPAVAEGSEVAEGSRIRDLAVFKLLGIDREVAGLLGPDAQDPSLHLLHLDLIPGQPLETALVRFAGEQGYTLDWQIEGGFDARHQLAYTGYTVAQVLVKVLPALGLSADVYTHDKHIVIRPGDSRN